MKVKSFHWEVNKKASLVLSGTDELLKGQLFNKLNTAYR
jgi:hypothetical protein